MYSADESQIDVSLDVALDWPFLVDMVVGVRVRVHHQGQRPLGPQGEHCGRGWKLVLTV